ncbi:MAG: UTP--glucose-1-phosphate uridylyltransferase [uncultured Nocardioidaceae bacterium]|uniref:UTP--glucose-1-phosphate uridylyltransferase n=1 Tax=uncultured Nocardioidaceae bacterium TaxID=253824 RepID=A0A6J4LRF9_9ACTN|nr:MAG: UTP--glucose-1-phosphate uridylyltransferase [uncultured Nocardioidaceae bacterium]
MSDEGLQQARDKMTAAGVDPVAIEVFSHYYRLVESGETGMVPEDTIDPLDMEALADVEVPEEVGSRALAETVVVKLNGGLGTSMGMDRAKSLLAVRSGADEDAGTTFLDVIARQVLSLRRRHGARLPLLFMNSFRTREDTLAALAAYDDLATDGLPLDFLQNKEPKLRADDLTPVQWPADPTLEWCPPGHGDLYTALRGQGLLEAMLEAGYRRVFVSNSDNLGAVPDPRVAGWFASCGAPFAIEAVRRTPSDRKGGHFAVRRSDGRIVLRETAQTLPEDKEALADLGRHRFASTNNLWFDLEAMRDELDRRDGVLGLALIKNTKTVDPSDPDSPEVVQIESAMGAAIEVFDGARTIEVGRERFVPVKTTNDLAVLRSDCYRLDEDAVLHQVAERLPFVDLSGEYKLVHGFEQRFPDGVPSLKDATSLRVEGDWTFGGGVVVVGDVRVGPDGSPGRVEAGTRLEG